MPAWIEDYALIGDCETAALVSREGSIDWLCLPRFDSAACFAALLGTPENGRWCISPTDEARITRSYRDGTLILETRFETATGTATLIDFMPPRDGAADIVRMVRGDEGTVAFAMDLVIRFDYGRIVPWVQHVDEQTLTAVAGPDLLVLRTPVPIHGEDKHTVASFTIAAGECQPFVLTHRPSHLGPPARRSAADAVAETEQFWMEFVDRCPKVGTWTADVRRSLVTLKALTYLPTGGIVAAATTSLPEHVGGPRNWDYRYCWLRDATLTLQAFMQLGYYGEALAWRDWLLRSVAGDPAQMQIMYGLAGERRLTEWEVPWLTGFLDSKPVRIGNAAADQFQLDVFGEVADALAQAARGGLPDNDRTRVLSEVMLPHLEEAWRQPDEGIWEVRGGRQHFTHSKIMAWVAFDRAAYFVAKRGDEAEAARWRKVAAEIHAEVCAKAWDPELRSFTQYYGSKNLDASVLHVVLTGFLPPEDERVIGTVEAVERLLMRDGFVLRYRTSETDDGLPEGEGAFLACSFWLCDAMVLLGRHEDARRLFERVRAVQNDLGLLAEEYDPVTGRMLGNFPQAFSHVGLINTALNLCRSEGPAEQRVDQD